jgi:serine/threonine protein kinase
MGEVWRATDTKLNRDVAIKILPEAFAQDADRMARFEREAQVLASLNHPNIAAIYGVEERALVMELVPGPTLAERIAQGPIPIDEALPVARQIAEALEYAHECGVVHRDLKPANIKVTPEGRVKVLDFGLAKAISGDTATGNAESSPTLTMRATKMGVILGTAAYMSPEQARGQTVDRARRHLGLRRGSIRDARWPCAVCRRDDIGHACGGTEDGARYGGGASGVAAHRGAMPAQRPAAAVAGDWRCSCGARRRPAVSATHATGPL